MKKETFVKLVDTLVSVCKNRDKMNDELVAVIKKHRHCNEELSFRDAIYDYTLEDTIIDVIEMEMGVYVRDRVADYVYEQHGSKPVCSPYPILDSAEDLYDDIMESNICGK
jgi:hypothetical protein